jgi:hypothetical protein
MKTRRRKQTSSTDTNVPKQKIIRRSKKKSNEISQVPDSTVESMISTDTINDNTTMQQILHTEQVHPPAHQYFQLHRNIVYLIFFTVLAAIISAYFFL